MKKLFARALRKAARIIDPEHQIRYLDDDFIRHVYYLNAGILEKGNVYAFDHAISRLPNDAPLLEIGSLCGLSANLLAYLKIKHGRVNPILTCDKWQFQQPSTGAIPYLPGSNILMEDLQSFAKEACARNIKMFSDADVPYTFEMTSDEFFSAWSGACEARDLFARPYRLGGPLSFCFIDGNHTYEYVKRDFLNCDAVLVSGGFLLFDDSTLTGDGNEVYRVMPEVAATARYELVMQNPYHLFRKR